MFKISCHPVSLIKLVTDRRQISRKRNGLRRNYFFFQRLLRHGGKPVIFWFLSIISHQCNDLYHSATAHPTSSCIALECLELKMISHDHFQVLSIKNFFKLFSPHPSQEQVVTTLVSFQSFLHMCRLDFTIEQKTNAEHMSPSGNSMVRLG